MKSPWMTSGMLKSINSKDKLYTKLVKTPKDTPDYEIIKINFKTYKNIIRRSIKEAKRLYYQNTFNRYSNDLRKTWQTINQALNKKSKTASFPSEFELENGTVVKDQKAIANEFNKYFISIGEATNNSSNSNYTTNDYKTYMKNRPNCTLQFNEITIDQTKQLIDSLKPKTSTGIDNLSNQLIKTIKDIIAEPLTIIINQMLNTGIFPDVLKISKVIPLFKKDDKSKFSNYRPISLLTSISKIFEKAILSQITEYLDINKIINANQYGFRKQHSTELASLQLVDFLYYKMDAKKTPLNIYLDLSKAFDTLDHNILLTKLKFYGITGMAHHLLDSYLSNRKQLVQFQETSSDVLDIKRGVPQGSILGPLLFIIYINDLPSSTNFFKFLMYADDTTLYCCIDDILSENRESKINSELGKVTTWMLSNRLTLNIKKTKYMLFHKHNKVVPNLNININTNIIERVSNFNFLGLHVASNLTWTKHTTEISKKISRMTGVLYRMRNILPRNILLSLYNTMILPHINYCLLSWGKESADLLLLQKRAARIITSAKYHAHSEPIFKCLNIMKIEDIYNQRLLTFYYNLINNNLPIYFTNFKPKCSLGSVRYQIRNPKFLLPSNSHEFIKSTCRYQLPTLLNKYWFPELSSINEFEKERLLLFYNTLKNMENTSLYNFKKIIKKYYIGSYSYACKLIHCYVCQ